MTDIYFSNLLNEEKASGLCIYAAPGTDIKDARSFFGFHALIPYQTHSLNVGIVEYPFEHFRNTDALVTFKEDLPIGVLTADCVPILIYSPDVDGAAAIHAGWKGSLGGIVDKTLDVLEARGAAPSQMKVAFGPSISMEWYEVDEDLADKFREAGFGNYVSYPSGEGGKPHIDLQGVNIERLVRRGVLRENIRPNKNCTYSAVDTEGNPVYQSHRRNPGTPGRNLAAICILSESEIEHYRNLLRPDRTK